MAKILIVGCGDIGTRLAILLSDLGHHVLGIKRKPTESDNKNLQFMAVDILQIECLKQLELDYNVVFFMPTPDDRTLKSYEDIYIHGLGNLLQLFSGAKHKPDFFFISSTSVYGQQQGEWVNEDSPTEPLKQTARTIVTAEQLIWQYNPNNTVVRFSGIYGPGRTHLLKKLDSSNKIQSNPPYFSNRIHQDDCARVLSFLLNRVLKGESLKPCYLASDDDPASLYSVLSWLAEQTGKPLPQQLEYGSGQNQNKRCQNTRLKQLGYRFIYPNYRIGYQSLLGLEFK